MLLSVLFVSLLAPAGAVAQSLGGAGLSEGVLTAASLSQEQQARIDAFVSRLGDLVFSEDRLQRRAARRDLIRPLQDRSASPAFRSAYGRLLMERVVRPAAERDSAVDEVFGISAASQIVTDEASGFVLGYLSDDRPAMRLYATIGLERTLFRLSQGAVSITRPGLDQIIRALLTQLEQTDDPDMLWATMRALQRATTLTSEQVDAVLRRPDERGTRRLGDRFMEAYTLGLYERVRDRTGEIAGDEFARAHFEAMGWLLGQALNPGSTATDDARRHIIWYAAAMLAELLDAYQNGNLGTGDEDQIRRRLLGSAEALIQFGCRALNHRGPETRDLRVRLESGETAAFRTGIVDIVGPNSRLRGGEARLPDEIQVGG